ncbi:MAG: DUF4136 domain-containing protein [Cyclobacteriaceae bacterium]|nr:DUF4136 domain-containing protein [Cyclobacteriaceae bacterium]UYN88300.1 MAG: DUF4136 domain-containing protein [Cyclobacteriaceae bacterium]
MKKLVFFIFIIGAFSCDTVRTEYDTSIDFSQYKTFCWLEGCAFTFTGPAYLDDSVVQSHVKESIISTMQKKGIQYNDNDPDLLVDFHITIENEKAIYYHGVQDDPYYYRTTFLQPEEVILTRGTLLIHVVDRQRSEVIWQSHAEGYLEDPPDLSKKNIQRGITRVLKDFPPSKK